LERLYRREHGSEAEAAAAAGPAWVLGPFRALYRLVLAPQDRLIGRIEEARLGRLTGLEPGLAPPALRRAWFDLRSTAAVVNFGLSTQLTLFALLLLVGLPGFYVYAVLLMGIILIII